MIWKKQNKVYSCREKLKKETNRGWWDRKKIPKL